MGIGATDETPGPVTATTGSITPQSGGGANVHRIALTNLPLGAAGRLRVRTTSNKGKVGDWSSLDDDDVHVELATIPGPPLDIVFQPFTDSPHILASLNSPDPADLRRAPAGRVVPFDMTPLAISASLIRDLVRDGHSARYLLPESVLDYIAAHHLYR